MIEQRQLRIASLNFAYYPHYGGAENQARLLAKALEGLGHEITVFTLQFPGTSPEDTVDGIPVIRFPDGPFEGAKARSTLRAAAAAFFQLRRRRHELDLVHLHGASFLLIPALLIKKLYGIPVVLKMAASGTTIGDVHIVMNSKLSWLKRKLLQDVDSFVCLNKESVLELKNLIPSARYVHIPNGVDCGYWSSPGPQIDYKAALGLAGYKTAIYAGRIAEGKGVDFLLSVWKEVTIRIPKARLFIVGDGPLQERMQDLARRSGLSEYVEFAGFKQDFRRLLFAMDVFLLFSPNEGMSNALLEAMAAGVPAVCTNNSGNAAIIENMSNGMMVEAGHVSDAVEKVCQLLERRQLAETFSGRASCDVRKKFDITVVARQYEELFSNLCQRSA